MSRHRCLIVAVNFPLLFVTSMSLMPRNSLPALRQCRVAFFPTTKNGCLRSTLPMSAAWLTLGSPGTLNCRRSGLESPSGPTALELLLLLARAVPVA